MFTIFRSYLSKDNIIRVSLLLIMISIIALLRVNTVQNVYADSDDEEITVYLTVSDRKGYVIGNDINHTVLARVPMKISYVDLAEYGMEDCYRYETESYMDGGIEKVYYKPDGNIIKKPTLLMLFLKALSKYYLGREITASDIAHGVDGSATLTYTGAPCSFFMHHFWGHDFNLNYYVNHEYPLMWEGWGATADYILLEDGDTVEVQLIGMKPFYKFDVEEEYMIQGDRFSPTLSKISTSWSSLSDMSQHESPVDKEHIRYSTDYGCTWDYIDGITDSNGQTNGCTLDTAGVYIFSSSSYVDENIFLYSLPTCVIHVKPKKVKGVSTGNGASGSIKYDFDEVKGAEGYNIFYCEQDASEWSEAKVETNEFVLHNAKPGTAYEFKASAYVTDKYVADGEPYDTLTGEESDVVTYTLSEDTAVIASADALSLVPAAEDVRLSDREVIEAARIAYDTLDVEQRKHIVPSDVARLETAEVRLAELQAEKDAKDRREAAAVTNMITALPSLTSVTYDDRDAVLSAYDAYEALSPEGKAMIQSLSVKKLKNLKAKIDGWDASAVEDLINALSSVASVKLTDKAQVSMAKAAYDALNDEAKAFVPAAAVNKLAELISKISQLEKEQAKIEAAQKLKVKGFKAKSKSRRFTLTWSKTKGASGYQIQYRISSSKKFKDLKKSYTKASLKTSKLKKGKKYVFRIRPYKTISGKKVYGKWTTLKAAKCK